MEQAARFFKDKKSPPDVPDSLHTTTFNRSATATDRKELFIDSTLSLQSDTFDLKDTIVRIKGSLVVAKSACLRNAKAYIQGNIVIKDNARIEFCSLMALGKAMVSDNAYVRGNIVCQDTISINDNARFAYPSFVYLSKNTATGRSNAGIVMVRDKAILTGTVATGRFGADAYNARVMVLGRARIEGVIMCPSAITPYGTVSGSIYTDRMVYRQESTVYENWLRDATIAGRDISAMILPLLFPTKCDPKYVRIEKR